MASLALVAGGCASTPSRTAQLPGAPWDNVIYDPIRPPRQSSAELANWKKRSYPKIDRDRSVAGATVFSGVLSRTQWASKTPLSKRMNQLGSVGRITVHHDGMSPFWSSSKNSSAARLEAIRRVHQDQRQWGDIGYHFIIDRAGRVWEGRPLTYQGAHVKEYNEHNIGVMCMGNFDRQSPTEAQFSSLVDHLQRVMSYYRVPVSQVRTHQEFAATACPGKSLQSLMNNVRRSSRLG